MKRKYLLGTLLSLAVLTAAAAFFFTSFKYSVQKDVSVSCVYMAYACGDCYPQYNVRNVKPSDVERKILNKDVDIEFVNKEQKDAFEKQVEACGICYIYEFKGELFYSKKKKCYVIKLREYKMTMKDKKCCDL